MSSNAIIFEVIFDVKSTNHQVPTNQYYNNNWKI